MSFPSDDLVAQTIAESRPAVLGAMKTVRSPKRSTRFRTTRNLIIVGVVIAALTGGAIVVATRDQGYIDHVVTCFEHASLDSHQQPVDAGGDTTDDPADPIGACSFIWSEGFFNENGPGGHDTPVPDLTVCTLSDGSSGVFPLEGRSRDGFCSGLGLPEWDPAPH